MLIVCSEDDSHETTNVIFSDNINLDPIGVIRSEIFIIIIIITECRLLQFCLAL